MVNYHDAVGVMVHGGRVARSTWGDQEYVTLGTDRRFYRHNGEGSKVFFPSEEDNAAKDWKQVFPHGGEER